MVQFQGKCCRKPEMTRRLVPKLHLALLFSLSLSHLSAYLGLSQIVLQHPLDYHVPVAARAVALGVMP